jgi:hypothetical protein
MLTRLADELWTIPRPIRFWGVETGTRMTIVRLPDGALFIHSPVALDRALRRAIDELGPVKAVVAPSLFHHLSVGAWMGTFPDAIYCCNPGLAKKRRDLPWDRILGDEPEPEWEGEIDQVHFSARTMEDEVVFHHRKSGTLVCCDAIFNLAKHPSRVTRAVAHLFGMVEPGATWLEPIMMRDRPRARDQVGRMLAWKADRIVLAHGDLIESGGEAVLRRAYAWL